MIINQQSLEAVYKGFRAVFAEAFDAVAPLYKKVAMLVPSTVREETYSWLGAFPRMREWVGERHIKNLSLHSYSVKNKDWEVTIEVDRNDMEDDSVGIYRPIVAELGRVSASHPDELVFNLLGQGFTTPCFDGRNFFDASHPVGDGVVSNTGGGTGTAWYLLDASKSVKPLIFQSRREPEFVAKDGPGDENAFMRGKYVYGVDRRDNAGLGLWQLAYGSKQELNAASYASARAAMLGMKDSEGRPLGVTPNLLVVPPSLESAARQILLNERDAQGEVNNWKGTAELLVVPHLG